MKRAMLIGMTTTQTVHYGVVLQRSTPVLLTVIPEVVDQVRLGQWVRPDLPDAASFSFRGWLMYQEEEVSRDLHDRGLLFHATEITLSIEEDHPIWLRFDNHEEVVEWHHRISA